MKARAFCLLAGAIQLGLIGVLFWVLHTVPEKYFYLSSLSNLCFAFLWHRQHTSKQSKQRLALTQKAGASRPARIDLRPGSIPEVSINPATQLQLPVPVELPKATASASSLPPSAFSTPVKSSASSHSAAKDSAKLERALQQVAQGETFTKFSKHGAPKKVLVKIDVPSRLISWESKKNSTLSIDDISEIRTGVQTPKFERRTNRAAVGAELLQCFSIVSKDGRTLDLQSGSLHQREVWLDAIEALRRRNR